MSHPHHISSRTLRFAVATIIGVATLAAVQAPAKADGTDPTWATCAQYTVPVTLTASDPTTYPVVGRLCLGSNSQRRTTVQLLVSGWSYDHNYWNISYKPNSYSWVWAETVKGYSTFSIDRLGVGQSGKPPAAALNVQNEAYVIQQLVPKLRSGAIGGVAFKTVVGVGHSLGAGILQYEAATVTTAGAVPDYLILEDFLTQTYAPGVARVAASLYPASSDPLLAGAGLPSGYLTTQPGTRAAAFYYLPGAEPDMISLDEALKQTGTDGERTSLAAARASTITHGVQVPTLLIVGQYDNLLCDTASGLSCDTAAAVMARESGNYSPRACLSAFVVPNSGHDVNLHIKALDAFNYAATWLDNYTINFATRKDSNGCIPS
jgi:pimeloyl-ACP methyl ester carboxylesterase